MIQGGDTGHERGPLAAARAGEERAFACLASLHRLGLELYCQRTLGCPSDAHEAVEESSRSPEWRSNAQPVVTSRLRAPPSVESDPVGSAEDVRDRGFQSRRSEHDPLTVLDLEAAASDRCDGVAGGVTAPSDPGPEATVVGSLE